MSGAYVGMLATGGSSALDGDGAAPQPQPGGSGALLVPDIGANGFSNFITNDVMYKIGNGEYANPPSDKPLSKVDSASTIALAQRYWSRTHGRVYVGNYSDGTRTALSSSDIQGITDAFVRARSRGQGIIFYVYTLPDLDGSSSRGAATQSAYKNIINTLISRCEANPDVPCWFNLEPDAILFGLDTSSFTDADKTYSGGRMQRRQECMRWVFQRFAAHPLVLGTPGDDSSQKWIFTTDVGTSNWRSPADTVARIIQFEAYRCSALIVGQANFDKRPALHARMASINGDSRLKAVRPGGMPYVMENFQIGGSAPIRNANRNVSGLSVTVGSPYIDAPAGTFQPKDATGQRSFNISGVTYATTCYIREYVSSSRVRMGTQGDNTGANSVSVSVKTASPTSGLSGVITYDKRDNTYNPNGPLAFGPALIWAPRGGHDGSPLCIGEGAFTNVLVSNDKWSPWVDGPGNAGPPGQPFQERIDRAVGPVAFFN